MSRADERQRGKVVGVLAFASFSLLHGFAGGIRMESFDCPHWSGFSRQPSDEKAAPARAVFSFSASAHHTSRLPRCFGTSGAESTFLQARAYSQERWWTVRGHQNRWAEAGTGRPCGLRAPPTIELAGQMKAPASDDGRLRAPATFIGLMSRIADCAAIAQSSRQPANVSTAS